MQGLAKSTLHTFKERVLGSHVRIFGNVAIAMAGCSIIENGTTEFRGDEALLLIKNDGTWRIVAQAWDMEGDKQAIPSDLLSND